jgi:hypothetical protein
MSTDQTPASNPFNRWWIVSVLFIVGIAVAIVLVVVLGRGADDGAAPAPSATSEESAQPAETEFPTDSGCDVDDADQDIPTTGPEAEWVAERYFFYPTSTAYGPVDSDGLWGCFAQSPTGALFAAANAVTVVSREDFADVVEANADDESGGAQFIAQTEDMPREQSAGRVAQIRGFTFTEVEPERVTVQLILGQDDIEAVSTATVVWDDARSTWLVDYGASSLVPTIYTGAKYTDWSANG